MDEDVDARSFFRMLLEKDVVEKALSAFRPTETLEGIYVLGVDFCAV